MKKKWIIIIVLLVAVGLAFVPSLLAGLNAPKIVSGPGRPGGSGKPGGAKNTATIFAVRTEDAQIRSLQAYIEVNGNIVSEQQVAVVPDSGGKLTSMQVALGSRVQRGTLVAQVDPSRPGAVYSLSPVYAPVSGIVVTSPTAVGSTVSTATALFTISVSDSVEIEANIPEREVGQLRIGLTAEVRFEAFPGEVFTAELRQLSPVVDPVSRTKKITLRLLKNESRINPGMFARIKLNTRMYENVVSIPKDAVIEARDKTVVYVLDNGDSETLRVSMREVETGVSIDNELEIKSGLNAGEKVVVQGQQFLTDGAAVRLLGNRN
ncbi:efflux RND transporter periplasmic adaptor subunit [Treponema sp. R80B11-R83G3]